MKRMLTIALSTLLAAAALAHGKVELGPNKGRLLEFSADHSLSGELTLKDGVFHVALLDKDMKPVALGAQRLMVIGGDRSKPEEIRVETADGRFTFPAPKQDGGHLILRFQPTADAKAVTTRFKFDTAVCGGCKNAEWLCTCH